MIGRIISDPIFQMGIFGVLVGTIAGLLALRSQVGRYPMAVTWGMRLVLMLGVLSLLLLTGWAGWDARSGQGGSHTVSFMPSANPTMKPTATPTMVPPPTPTPHLSRSITRVLTAFCQALTARDYQTAWSMYAKSLQRRHSYTAVVAAWSHYRQCSIPAQSFDPDAIALLTLTLAPGMKDQYGYTGDTDERFTMGVEAQTWKITQACHVISYQVATFHVAIHASFHLHLLQRRSQLSIRGLFFPDVGLKAEKEYHHVSPIDVPAARGTALSSRRRL